MMSWCSLVVLVHALLSHLTVQPRSGFIFVAGTVRFHLAARILTGVCMYNYGVHSSYMSNVTVFTNPIKEGDFMSC